MNTATLGSVATNATCATLSARPACRQRVVCSKRGSSARPNSSSSRKNVGRVQAVSGVSADDDAACAWRGDQPTQSSLPLLADGTPDYSSYDANPVYKVLIATIRKLLVNEVGEDRDPRPWTNFDGMLTSVRNVNDMPGTATDVQVRAERVFANLLPNLGIGWVIPLWRSAVQPVVPAWMANYAFVLVFLTLFPWLMGPLKGTDEVEVKVPSALRKVFKRLPETVMLPQSVQAERCRFIESTQCASVCVNSCKVPSQEWLFKDFGMEVHIRPNYDDFSCNWKFGIKPPPLVEDEAIMVPCFAKCDSEFKGEKDAFRQRLRAESGFGMEGGIDKYSGESLDAIVARASAAALADAAAGTTPDGTAGSSETLKLRADATASGGKCWSVDDARQAMTSPSSPQP